MTIKSLSILKGITAWGGVVTTLIGVAFGIYRGADIWSFTTTLIGVALTSMGHLIGIAQSRHQKAEKVSLEMRLVMMDHRIKEAHDKPATFS
jgi:hypothetical protein